MTFHMPNSYYDPPEYDGCEDCECFDPEFAERPTCTCGPEQYGECAMPCENKCECKCHSVSRPCEDDD